MENIDPLSPKEQGAQIARKVQEYRLWGIGALMLLGLLLLIAVFLLANTSIISTEPVMASEPMNLFPSDIQFSYFRNISAGESQRILFHMRAEQPGVYAGNIGIYTDDLDCAFHYQNAEIEILP